MTSPSALSGSEDIPLAEVKVGLSEVLQVLALIASLATALFGHDFGITKNAQAIAQLAVFLIPMGMAVARSIKHKGVAHANALVTVAQIEAAARALVAAQQKAQPGGPTPDSATATAPTPTTPPTVAVGYDGAAPVGRHEADDLGLPVQTVSTTLDAGHGQVELLALLLVVTTGVFLGGLVLHLVLT